MKWRQGSMVLLFCVLTVFFTAQLFSTVAVAQIKIHQEVNLDKVENWQQFSKAMDEDINSEESTGRAYMISGGLLLLGGIVGYNGVNGSVERLAYSVVQSIGVAGIGYGAYLYKVGSDDRAFYETVQNANGGLPNLQKDLLFSSYKKIRAERKRNEKYIRMIAHSLVAAVNFYNASKADQSDLRQGLYVLGGVNALVAISLAVDF